MNSKLRCTACKGYYDHDGPDAHKVGLSGVCSSECLDDYLQKCRNKRARRKIHRENKHKYGRRLPGQIRDVVRKRDGARCRFCGTSENIQIHHILYRSQGGGDVEWNLISLCHDHHQLMHSSKRKWQPVLQMTQLAYYQDGLLVTVPEVERLFGDTLSAELLPGEPDDIAE